MPDGHCVQTLLGMLVFPVDANSVPRGQPSSRTSVCICLPKPVWNAMGSFWHSVTVSTLVALFPIAQGKHRSFPSSILEESQVLAPRPGMHSSFSSHSEQLPPSAFFPEPHGKHVLADSLSIMFASLHVSSAQAVGFELLVSNLGVPVEHSLHAEETHTLLVGHIAAHTPIPYTGTGKSPEHVPHWTCSSDSHDVHTFSPLLKCPGGHS